VDRVVDVSTAPRENPAQLSFDELGTSLAETTFVVVDTETTGTSAGSDGLTEIGAVKVRGGEVLGEFTTLVNPGVDIPPQVVALTGITPTMVAEAPSVEQVLPSFLEFCAGSVLVAHNAKFDTAFLKAACEHHNHAWPKPSVVCTLRLARRVIPRGETPNHKLGTLSTLLGIEQTPTHRALDDARATVELLHSLLERIGPDGVHSLQDLLEYLPDTSPQVRRKRTLAAHLPDTAGVYLFRGPNEEVLYVGTASNLRRRVRQYFSASEQRGRMREMVQLSQRVDHVECAHSLEAHVRELRLLAAHRPAYNRRSRNPGKEWWIVLTDEPFPRLSVVRKPREQSLGPFASRTRAHEAAQALAGAVGLRTCTQRIPARGAHGSPCVLAELGQCGAPCAGHEAQPEYAAHATAARDLFEGYRDTALRLANRRVEGLAAAEHFEQAAARRDELATLIRTAARGHRLAALARIAELVAAAPDGAGGWEFAVVRYGRLASAGVARRGTAPLPVVDALVAAAEAILPGDGPLRGARSEETAALLRWLDTKGVRLVRTSAPWCESVASAAAWSGWLQRVTDAAELERDHEN